MMEIHHLRLDSTHASNGTLSDVLGNQSGKPGVLVTRLRNRVRDLSRRTSDVAAIYLPFTEDIVPNNERVL